MQNLNNSIKDYEDALTQLGKNVTEVLNLGKHHNTVEASMDDLIEELEKNVINELGEENNEKFLDSIVEILGKI